MKVKNIRVATKILKILEEHYVKFLLLLEFGNLYQSSITLGLGLEPVSIIHYTRPGSSIKQPSLN